MLEQLVVFGVLGGALVLFVTGWLRYDLVALVALLVVALTGVIDRDEVFTGFANPAVVTVVAVLVLSRALENAGLVDVIGTLVARVGDRLLFQVAALTGLVTLLSAFINNVGALALLMPVAIQLARKSGRSPSYLLMPMAFGSLLGGMTTLIGTPPNLIIANFRRQATGEPFGMFDFTPVGLAVAVAGVSFIVLLGWRMVPRREGQRSRDELFEIGDYLSEVHVPESSIAIGKLLRELLNDQEEIVVVTLLRGTARLSAPSLYFQVREGDVLVLRGDSETLGAFADKYGLELIGDKALVDGSLSSEEVSLVEAVVTRYSPAERRTAKDLDLRRRFRANLLALARRGQALEGRLRDERFRAGDVLLLQMPSAAVSETLTSLGLLPLAERGVKLGGHRRLVLTLFIFATALLSAALGLLPSAVAFATAAVLMVLVGVLSLREAYASVDWPIVVLLGGMIPVGQALEATGGAASIAGALLGLGDAVSPVVMLTLVLIVTMFLSDIINNAAAAILMAPIGISVAQGLGVSVDAFLLAIAIGASCAFLTPVGHQSNTLVMGPGGYRFGDYWRMGLALELIIVLVAIPLLRLFWLSA